MQTVLSKIWTHIAEFISYNVNHNITNACKYVLCMTLNCIWSGDKESALSLPLLPGPL